MQHGQDRLLIATIRDITEEKIRKAEALRAGQLAAIGELVAELPCLYLVDAVTSLGGIEVAMDGWHIDALYSGTQKCLSCPPGLAPISLSEAAVKKLMTRADKVPNWYLDLSLIANYWEGEKRT